MPGGQNNSTHPSSLDTSQPVVGAARHPACVISLVPSHPAGQPYLSLWTGSLPQCTAKPSFIHMLPAHPHLLSMCFQHLPSLLRKGQRVRNSQQISQEDTPGLARLCPHHGGPLNHIHSAASSGAQARPQPRPCLCREDEEATVSRDKELGVSCTHSPRNQPQSPSPLIVGSGSRHEASSG